MSAEKNKVQNIGVDQGNTGVKVVGPNGEDYFLSDIGEYRDIEKTENYGADDMIWSLKKPDGSYIQGFAGSLAKYESEFAGSIMGGTKAHEDGMIRVLLALHRYSKKDTEPHFNTVVSQPIKFHKEAEKEKIKKMLIGEHEVTVNGVRKLITIEDCGVAAEGAAAYWVINRGGKVRVFDLGGGTFNFATMINKKFIDKDSDTFPFGTDSRKNKDMAAISRAMIAETSKICSQDDEVFVCGGKAEEIIERIQAYYPKAEVIKPKIQVGGDPEVTKTVGPVFANAAGNYEIAKRLWK